MTSVKMIEEGLSNILSSKTMRKPEKKNKGQNQLFRTLGINQTLAAVTSWYFNLPYPRSSLELCPQPQCTCVPWKPPERTVGSWSSFKASRLENCYLIYLVAPWSTPLTGSFYVPTQSSSSNKSFFSRSFVKNI